MKKSRCILYMCCVSLLACTILSPLEAASADSLAAFDTQMKWVKIERFSGSDKNYVALRKQFESLIVKNAQPIDLYHKNLAKAERGDLAALYIVGLSANKNWNIGTTLWAESRKISEDAYELLEKAPALPQSYEFVRMRFLVASRLGWAQAKYIAPVGRMLLKKQPNDRDVEFRYARALIDSAQTKSDRQIALQYVLRLQKRYPADKDSVRSQLASIYSRLANTGEDPTARDKEIAIYEAGLKDFRSRPQTARVKESIANTTLLLNAARKEKDHNG